MDGGYRRFLARRFTAMSGTARRLQSHIVFGWPGECPAAIKPTRALLCEATSVFWRPLAELVPQPGDGTAPTTVTTDYDGLPCPDYRDLFGNPLACPDFELMQETPTRDSCFDRGDVR